MKAVAQIFLSYAREDKEKVEKLYQKLSGAGFKPWMDKKDILPGEQWKSRIPQAIRRSDFFLACLSANSVSKRGWIQKEIKDALDIWQERLEDDIYLIPVRLEDCQVPESLRDFQWVNLFEEDGWTRLVKAIQVGMERQEEGPERAHNLMITWGGSESGQQTALVLAADQHTTLGALVELLVEHWDLPVWQDEPIAYDLLYTLNEEPLDLSRDLSDLPLDKDTELRLVSVTGRLVMAQSPADIPVFDVWHPDTETGVSVLALPEALTAAELQDRLEKLWALPSLLNGEPVYYELCLQDDALLPYKRLSALGVDDGSTLALVRQPGIWIVPDEELEPDFRIEVVEVEEAPDVEVTPPRETVKEASQREFPKYLRRAMDAGLSEADLDVLIFDLGIDETFTGEKKSRIIALIQYYRRRNKLDELLSELCDMFPHVKERLIKRGCEAWLPP